MRTDYKLFHFSFHSHKGEIVQLQSTFHNDYKNICKRDLKALNIDTGTFEETASDRYESGSVNGTRQAKEKRRHRKVQLSISRQASDVHTATETATPTSTSSATADVVNKGHPPAQFHSLPRPTDGHYYEMQNTCILESP